MPDKNRSYEIDVCSGGRTGYLLFCFEDDQLVWHNYYKDHNSANEQGKKFIKEQKQVLLLEDND